jgi:predicted dehydrogenase
MIPLQLGVVGCGRVFERFHLPAIDRTPDVALIAAADPDPARLAWAGTRSPRPAVAESLNLLLGQARLDAVLILTPPATHVDLAVHALDSRLHVLVEKPMGLTAADGRRIAEAASRSGRRVQVGYARRFREPYRALQALLRQLGTTPAGIDFELAFATAEWGAHSGFLGDETLGGGPLEDVLSHQADLLSWLLGAGPAAARAEVGGKDARVARAELRFGRVTAGCLAAHGTYAERLDVVLGDGRVLEASGSRLRAVARRPGAWRRRQAMLLDRVALAQDKLLGRPSVSRTSFERQLRDFAVAAGGGPATGATAEDGLRVLQILDACRWSAQHGGEWVPLD